MTKQAKPRIGFIGLGRMGRHMASHLVEAGYPLSVWNRTAAKANQFADKTGASAYDDPALMARDCDLVISMLADDAAASAVYLGENGIIDENEGDGAQIFVEMGTLSPDMIAEIAATGQKSGKRFIDAPVSGATQAAENGQLLIMAGGVQNDFPALAAIFELLGKKTIWLGATGSGAVMKLSVNMLLHGINQSFAEALSLAVHTGIDEETAFEVFENSAAAAPMLSYRKPLYLTPKAHDVTFTIDLVAKDLRLAEAVAQKHNLEVHQLKTNLGRAKAAIAQQLGQEDMAAIYQFVKGA